MADLLLKTAGAAALTTVTQVSWDKQADLKCLTLTQAAPITHTVSVASAVQTLRASARRYYICFCFITGAIFESIPVLWCRCTNLSSASFWAPYLEMRGVSCPRLPISLCAGPGWPAEAQQRTCPTLCHQSTASKSFLNRFHYFKSECNSWQTGVKVAIQFSHSGGFHCDI